MCVSILLLVRLVLPVIRGSMRRLICVVCVHILLQVEFLYLIWRFTQERSLISVICQYSTKFKHALVNHMKIHTGEKPYKCDICQYSSAHRSALFNHMKTHSGEKPFKCDLCQYSTAYKHRLVSHMRTHTEEKPFNINPINDKLIDSEKPVNVNGHLNSDENFEKGNMLTLKIKEESHDDGVQRWIVIGSELKQETD